ALLRLPQERARGHAAGLTMLELRPTCEHCNTALPPESINSGHSSFRPAAWPRALS
ncbi:MAG: DUF1272 domain-containing protein, partial [Variovorax sp.]